MALQSAERVIVQDVTQSEIFAGQPSLDILLEAGVRAVQSTPLISSAGTAFGMISTHFSRPHRPNERDLRLMDLLARQAADYLERKKVEEAAEALSAELKQILDTSATGLAHCSRELRYVAANPAFAKVAGVPLDQRSWARKHSTRFDPIASVSWRASVSNSSLSCPGPRAARNGHISSIRQPKRRTAASAAGSDRSQTSPSASTSRWHYAS